MAGNRVMATKKNSGGPGLAAGARQLPPVHVSVRVPWHDAGWDGTVCRKPRENTSCLILKNVAETKDDGAETRVATKEVRLPVLTEGEFPACASERGFFMAPFEVVRNIKHAYARDNSKTHAHLLPTPFAHPAYSAAGVPFRWMNKSSVEGTEAEVGLEHPSGYFSLTRTTPRASAPPAR